MVLRPTIFGAALALWGCSDGSYADQSGNVVAPSDDYFVDDDVLRVDLDRSPSNGGAFDFCTAPGAPELNLKNAAWLGFLAANEYAHLGYIAPALSTLGFGNDGAGDLLWVKCAKDLRQVRKFEKDNAAELATEIAKGPESFLEYLSFWTSNGAFEQMWGSCAISWFENEFDGKRYPAAAFEEYLIQTPHEHQYIQFFSGGAFEIDGNTFTKGSTQVMFARHGELPVAIVSFRGTEPDQWQDISVDAAATRVTLEDKGYPDDWGKVHKGFFNAFESVADERLMDKIQQLEGTGVQLWLTGHSLGGALATVLAARILRDMEAGANYAFGGVYTFGSPRVGNGDFQEQLEDLAEKHGVKLVRFRNGKDVVTTIPPKILYSHVGQVAYVDDAMLMVDDEPGFGFTLSAADHDVSGYDAAMKPVSGYYRRVKAHMDDPRYDKYDVCNGQSGPSDDDKK